MNYASRIISRTRIRALIVYPLSVLALVLGVAPAADAHTGSLPPKPPVCTITGTAGPDVLKGTSRKDIICGLGGNDVIKGAGGADIIEGGAGNDRLTGGPGKDSVLGGPGKDRLQTRDRSRDALHGGPGRDRGKTDRREQMIKSVERVNGRAVGKGPSLKKPRSTRSNGHSAQAQRSSMRASTLAPQVTIGGAKWYFEGCYAYSADLVYCVYVFDDGQQTLATAYPFYKISGSKIHYLGYWICYAGGSCYWYR